MKKITNFIKNLFYPAKVRSESIRSNRKINTYSLIEDEIMDAIGDRVYLQPGFGLSHLCQHTGVPYHRLTSYFNSYLGITFNDWKNNLRIEYILEQFEQGRNKNLTLEAISREAGYLSRSNFINSFIKKTGMSPSSYINFLIKQRHAK